MPLTTKHQVLAWDLVESLGDEKHKGIYFRLAKIYDESFLREILSIVKMAYNEKKIKAEDRGRYFMGILKKELKASGSHLEIYGKNTKNSTRGRSGVAQKSGSRKRSKKRGN